MRVGLVSNYLPRGEKMARLGANAEYSANLIHSLPASFFQNNSLTVFANIVREREEYDEGPVKVVRCFHRGKLKYFIEIVQAVRKNSIDIVHLQHELFHYGGLLTAVLFPLLVLLFRLSGKTTIVTIHGVLPLRGLSIQMAKENMIKGSLLMIKLGLFVIYKLILCFSEAVIVHEEYLRDLLVIDYGANPKKVFVNHLGIENLPKNLSKENARKQLLLPDDKKIVLFFGFITGYKGLGYLLDAFKLLDKQYHLVIAGGPPARMKGSIAYGAFYKSLLGRVADIGAKRVLFTGKSIPDNQIELYYRAADLLVLPYTIAMSASGPLALAVAYETPVLLSDNFLKLFPGMPRSLTFPLDSGKLAKAIEEVVTDESKIRCSKNFITLLKKERAWPAIGARTVKIYQTITDRR